MTKSFESFKNSYGTYNDYLNRGYLQAYKPIPSNIAPLDKVLNGGFRGGSYVIGGEPAAGKSAFALFLAMMASISGAKVMFCSLEMSRYQCIERCASFWSLQTGKEFAWSLAWQLGLKARQKDREAKRQGKAESFVIDAHKNDPVVMAVDRLEKECSGLIIADAEELHDIAGIEQAAISGREAGLDMVIVDYLQIINAGDIANEYERVTTVSRRLRHLGTLLNIPIVALSSCSRDGNNKPPSMHNFKGSGNLEYDAVAAAIIRANKEDSTIRELHVVKNRTGMVTDPEKPLYFRFDGAHGNFELV